MCNSLKEKDLSVCWCGAFSYVLAQCQGGKDFSNDLRETIIAAAVNLGRIIKPFPI